MTIFLLQLSRINQQSTQSYSNGLKAEQLAQGALEFITLDLIRELQSTKMSTLMPPPPSATPANHFDLYRPNRTWDMIPKAWSTNNDPLSSGSNISLNSSEKLLLDGIVRTSSLDSFPKDEYANPQGQVPTKLPSPLAIPSSVSSYSRSKDGRALSFDYWNKISLLKNDTLTDLAFEKIKPDWVIVTRAGPKQFLTWDSDLADKASNNYAIGRFAYVIYDVGGRLDADWAGYPKSGAGKPADLDIARKGNIAFADLEQVGLTPAQIQNLFSWRTAGQVSTSIQVNSWIKNLFGENLLPSGEVDPSKPNWASQGFTRTPTGYNAFLNRQDFLSFAKKEGFLNSARFFTVGNTSIQAPSYFPTYDCLLDADRPGTWKNTNPDSNFSAIRNLRYRTMALNPSVEDPTNQRVNGHLALDRHLNGSLLVSKKFPLSYLNLLTPTATAAQNSEIHRRFGLLRNSANQPWTYCSPDTSTIADHVKRLSELPLDPATGRPRDPDFFEAMQAAILWGSSSRGQKRDTSNYLDRNGVDGNNFGLQALRSGLAVIDQYDSDSFPTVVMFNAKWNKDFSFPDVRLVDDGAADSYTLGYPVSGIENIPYISEFSLRPCRSTADQRKFGMWMVFEMWNPHQNAEKVGNYPTASFPAKLRVVISDGIGALDIRKRGSESGTGSPQIVTPYLFFKDTFKRSDSSTLNSIEFSVSNTNNFSDPTILTKSNSTNLNPTQDLLSPNTAGPTGICAGISTDSAFDKRLQTVAPDAWLATADEYGNIWRRGGGYVVEAQYWNGSRWMTYQILSEGYTGVNNDGIGANKETVDYNSKLQAVGTYKDSISFTNPEWTFFSLFRPDPRGAAFGFAHQGWGATPGRSNQWGASASNPANGFDFPPIGEANSSDTPTAFNPYADGDRSSGPANVHFYSPGTGWDGLDIGALSDNRRTAGSASPPTCVYFDADGIARPADGNNARGVFPAASLSSLINGGLNVGDIRQSRPVILNRPFRSIGEMGFASRSQPWKSLNFSMGESADSGLLEMFTLQEKYDDKDQLQMGLVNPNSAPKEVLSALIQNTGLNGIDLESLNSTPALLDNSTKSLAIASDLYNLSHDNFTVAEKSGAEPDYAKLKETGPLWHVGELATRWGEFRRSKFATNIKDGYSALKAEREAPLRALSSTTQFRTWNLLIDVTAQSGNYLSSSSSLSQFNVVSERRYWLQISIDRFNGKILSSKIEVVHE